MERAFSAAPRLKAVLVAAIAGLTLVGAAPPAGATGRSGTARAGTGRAGTHYKRHHRHTHVRHQKRRHHRHPAAAAQAQAASTTSSASAPAAPAPSCTNVDTPAGSAAVSTLDATVVCLINHERTSRGLAALVPNSKLDSSAQSWSAWMITNEQFTHGTDFAGRISAVGYDWQTAGENIATGYATPHEVVAAWMASADHCRNILDPNFRDVGTGLVDAPVAGWASDPATWTQDFGLAMSAVAPSSNAGPQNGCPYGG